jgi:hypothetical protein
LVMDSLLARAMELEAIACCSGADMRRPLTAQLTDENSCSWNRRNFAAHEGPGFASPPEVQPFPSDRTGEGAGRKEILKFKSGLMRFGRFDASGPWRGARALGHSIDAHNIP